MANGVGVVALCDMVGFAATKPQDRGGHRSSWGYCDTTRGVKRWACETWDEASHGGQVRKCAGLTARGAVIRMSRGRDACGGCRRSLPHRSLLFLAHVRPRLSSGARRLSMRRTTASATAWRPTRRRPSAPSTSSTSRSGVKSVGECALPLAWIITPLVWRWVSRGKGGRGVAPHALCAGDEGWQLNFTNAARQRELTVAAMMIRLDEDA